jgi:death-on-curing family protein
MHWIALRKNKRVPFKLDAAYVQYLHDKWVSGLWPGADPVPTGGCRDRGLLESAVNRPFQSAFGKDAYPDILGKAAALFHSLVANHCFMDGNKRTAVVALNQFLMANGIFTVMTNEQIYALARETASHRVRGISPDDAYNAILGILKAGTRSFARVKTMESDNPELNGLHASVLEYRRAIRKLVTANAKLEKLSQDSELVAYLAQRAGNNESSS